MHSVVMPGRQQALDRYSKKDDSALVAVNAPSRDAVIIRAQRESADLEAHLLQFGPGSAQKLHCGADRGIEAIDAAIQRRQRRPNDLAAPQAPVATMARSAARRGGTACGGTVGHDQSLWRPARHPAGAPS